MAKDFNEEEAAGMAAKMGTNATDADIQSVASKMGSMNKGPLAKVWYKVTQLWDAFKSPNTPVSLKAIIIGALIYMVTPIDLVPDFIPVAGLLDDVGVIGMVFRQFLKLAALAAISAGVYIVIKEINKKKLKETLQDKMKNNDAFQNAFKAKIKEKSDKSITLDVLSSWDSVVVEDVHVTGESVSDDIQVGLEIILQE